MENLCCFDSTGEISWSKAGCTEQQQEQSSHGVHTWVVVAHDSSETDEADEVMQLVNEGLSSDGEVDDAFGSMNELRQGDTCIFFFFFKYFFGLYW